MKEFVLVLYFVLPGTSIDSLEVRGFRTKVACETAARSAARELTAEFGFGSKVAPRTVCLAMVEPEVER